MQKVNVKGSSQSSKRKKAASETNALHRKGVAWTEAEHRLFLLGLEEYGRGAWRSIAKDFVTTRTATQVASHAQKYYLRQSMGSARRQKKRPSIHDISTPSEGLEAWAVGDRCELRDGLRSENELARVAEMPDADGMLTSERSSNDHEGAITAGQQDTATTTDATASTPNNAASHGSLLINTAIAGASPSTLPQQPLRSMSAPQNACHKPLPRSEGPTLLSRAQTATTAAQARSDGDALMWLDEEAPRRVAPAPLPKSAPPKLRYEHFAMDCDVADSEAGDDVSEYSSGLLIHNASRAPVKSNSYGLIDTENALHSADALDDAKLDGVAALRGEYAASDKMARHAALYSALSSHNDSAQRSSMARRLRFLTRQNSDATSAPHASLGAWDMPMSASTSSMHHALSAPAPRPSAQMLNRRSLTAHSTSGVRVDSNSLQAEDVVTEALERQECGGVHAPVKVEPASHGAQELLTHPAFNSCFQQSGMPPVDAYASDDSDPKSTTSLLMSLSRPWSDSQADATQNAYPQLEDLKRSMSPIPAESGRSASLLSSQESNWFKQGSAGGWRAQWAGHASSAGVNALRSARSKVLMHPLTGQSNSVPSLDSLTLMVSENPNPSEDMSVSGVVRQAAASGVTSADFLVPETLAEFLGSPQELGSSLWSA